MLKLIYNHTKTDIKKNNLPAVDLDLQKLLMHTKYPQADYQYLIQLKCSIKKLIESKKQLTKQGIENLLNDITHATRLSHKIRVTSK